MTPVLRITKVGRRYAICAGVSRLATFASFDLAAAHLAENLALYRYWAGSASVSVDNTPARIIEA